MARPQMMHLHHFSFANHQVILVMLFEPYRHARNRCCGWGLEWAKRCRTCHSAVLPPWGAPATIARGSMTGRRWPSLPAGGGGSRTPGSCSIPQALGRRRRNYPSRLGQKPSGHHFTMDEGDPGCCENQVLVSLAGPEGVSLSVCDHSTKMCGVNAEGPAAEDRLWRPVAQRHDESQRRPGDRPVAGACRSRAWTGEG